MNALKNYTKDDAKQAFAALQQFVAPSQLLALRELCQESDERQFYINKMVEIAEIVKTMPKTYEQDGAGEQAIAYLHYFKGGFDWYITEKDMEEEQYQAYGKYKFHEEGVGYISVVELLANEVELDLHFTPRPLAEIN